MLATGSILTVNRRTSLVPFLISIVWFTLIPEVALGATSYCSGPLVVDFSTYWLCARQLLLGGDPYDPHQMQVLASSFGCEVTGPSYISPWFLVLLLPLAALPLKVAALVWSLLNLTMIAHITTWTLRTHTSNRFPRPSILLTLAASPGVLMCLLFGQFGIVCLWGMVMVARLYERQGLALSIALVIGSLKPHIGWAYWLFTGSLLVMQRRFRVLAISGALALLSVVFVSFWAPGSFESWQRVYGSALSWMGASVITPLRLLTARPGADAPAWPALIVMLLGVLLVGSRLHKGRESINLPRELPWLTTLAICTTPYVWSLDFCVLLPAELVVLSDITARQIRRSPLQTLLAPILIIVGRIALFSQLIFVGGDWRTWWYPPLVALALFIRSSGLRSQESITRGTEGAESTRPSNRCTPQELC